ncbi:hypothetical protein N8T08_001267 [Aspergillus melleus]|uniref:Uncharacterized protein n=1 Tax=Aspergillus melleus TaxID=138277 RepID=A0ACC3ANH6_9EURO|nr:hypothetical protein N8T08_001267 [Aspergillus melleus]
MTPNYGAALAFRFLCALFAATPMTVAGGTIGDIWTPMQIPFGLPLITICAYAGPILGPVIGAYTPQIGFEWADWDLYDYHQLRAGVCFPCPAGNLQSPTPQMAREASPQSHGRRPVPDRAYHDVRQLAWFSTASQYVSAIPDDLDGADHLDIQLLSRPALLVLFTFLNGYPYIFTQPYGISTSRRKGHGRGQKPLQPEVLLYWAMAGSSILMPVSLFWIAWTCYSDISIWSPIVASGVFGYALVCIFTTTYMYILFVYLQYAALALGFMTFARYVISGALSPASIKMHDNLGPHLSLTIVAAIAAVMAPVPYLLCVYGHRVRAMSRNVQNKA